MPILRRERKSFKLCSRAYLLISWPAPPALKAPASLLTPPNPRATDKMHWLAQHRGNAMRSLPRSIRTTPPSSHCRPPRADPATPWESIAEITASQSLETIRSFEERERARAPAIVFSALLFNNLFAFLAFDAHAHSRNFSCSLFDRLIELNTFDYLSERTPKAELFRSERESDTLLWSNNAEKTTVLRQFLLFCNKFRFGEFLRELLLMFLMLWLLLLLQHHLAKTTKSKVSRCDCFVFFFVTLTLHIGFDLLSFPLARLITIQNDETSRRCVNNSKQKNTPESPKNATTSKNAATAAALPENLLISVVVDCNDENTKWACDFSCSARSAMLFCN